MSLLEIRDLSVTFGGWRGAPPVHAVKRASFTLDRGETLALVGESGSGKSVTALSILQLLPYPVAAHGVESSVRFAGEELVGAAPERLRRVRGNRIAMVFQEPMTSLNPLHTAHVGGVEPCTLPTRHRLPPRSRPPAAACWPGARRGGAPGRRRPGPQDKGGGRPAGSAARARIAGQDVKVWFPLRRGVLRR